MESALGLCQKKMRLFKGRSSKGIRGINLQDNDSVMSLSVIDSSKSSSDISKKMDQKNFH